MPLATALGHQFFRIFAEAYLLPEKEKIEKSKCNNKALTNT